MEDREALTKRFRIYCMYQFLIAGLAAFAVRADPNLLAGLDYSIGKAVVITNCFVAIGIVIRPLAFDQVEGLSRAIVPAILGATMPIAASVVGAAITTGDPRWYMIAIAQSAVIAIIALRPPYTPIPKKDFLQQSALSLASHVAVIFLAAR